MEFDATRLARSVGFERTHIADLDADLAKLAVPESVRRGLHGFGGNLSGLSYDAHVQSNVLRFHRIFGNLGPSGPVAHAFKLKSIALTNGATWSLHRVLPVRTLALQSLLKSVTTIGPIVVSPDDDMPLDYHPDLQGWLIPDTATGPEAAIDVEELRAQMVAIITNIATRTGPAAGRTMSNACARPLRRWKITGMP